jgi:hypothetical protein
MLLQQTAYFSNDQTKSKNGHVSGSLTINLAIDEGHGQIYGKIHGEKLPRPNMRHLHSGELDRLD